MQTSKEERKHRDILLMYILWQEIRSSHRCHRFNRTSRGRHYKERVFSFLFLTSGHESSRCFCSFNLALGSQRDSYVATNSYLLYCRFFLSNQKRKKVRNFVTTMLLTINSLLILSENNYVQCIKFKRFNA